MPDPMPWLPGLPVIQAPMAGGASTPELAASVSGAGGLGFLAAGYKTAARMRQEIERTRGLTPRPFGVNVFMPTADEADPAELDAYARVVEGEARRLGTEPGVPHGGDDDFAAKIEDLLAAPPALVSFTFGCPEEALIRALRSRGAAVVVTVTSPAEARLAASADALWVQGREAGGHRGSFANNDDEAADLDTLLSRIREVSRLPLIAAGGIASASDVSRVLSAGAVAAAAGTAFLLCPESGTGAVHRAALTDPRFTRTGVTRAFTGRPARGLVNRFMTEYSGLAPAAYPQVHHLTAPLRRAAAAQGDAETLHLWAGTSWTRVRPAPAASVTADLAAI
ncbi:nitronate monooxygenase [Planobispora takensis]|uniref:Propionate 3-nitronate monooxygenase n=1 Tax=Planobispora takensis TaxID=1367882 RepID=A0A8J3T2M7_9ACTN|nr:nitronate monooxygenase [Planobispora takensis]GII05189.1 oxidoreductase [Planobispora takensis]